MLCVLALAGLPATGTAAAAEPVLPLGTDGQGVHLDVRRVEPPYYRERALILTFDASAADRYRQIAGKILAVDCVRFDRRLGPFRVESGGGSEQPAPRRRHPIVVMRGRIRYDLCNVGVRHGRRTTVLARIPLTPLGATRLDERNTAATLIAAVRALARPERPSAATVAVSFHGVVLADPAQVPPPGVLGVYSDGAQHVYAAQTDLAGKLLFVEQNGAVTRSNVFEYLLDLDRLG